MSETQVDTHSRFSPSRLPRIVPCPGSVQLCEGLVRKTSTYAQEGSMLHKVVELCLDGNHSEVPDFMKKSYELNMEHVEAVNDCLDYVSMLRLEHADAEDYFEMYETQATLEHFDDDTVFCPELEEVYGTVDYIMMVPAKRKLIVIDWKFGKNVEVWPDSEQLKAYALGKLKNTKVMNNYDTVQIVVGQPRLYGGEKFKSQEFTPQELYSWLRGTLVPALQNAVSKEPVLNPTEKGCMFCDAKRRCVARTAQAVEIASQVFEAYAEIKQPNADLATISKLMDQFDTLRKYMDDMEKLAVGIIMSGKEFPGKKLVYGRSNRKWASENQAREWLESHGYDVSELSEVKFYSPSKVETTLGSKVKKDKEFQALVIKPQGNPTLVDLMDPREAIKYDSASEKFADFADEE